MARFYLTDKKEFAYLTICKNNCNTDMTTDFMQNFSDFTDYAKFNEDLQVWEMDSENFAWWQDREKEETEFNELLKENNISYGEFMEWVEKNYSALSTDYEVQCKEKLEYLKEMIAERK